ncbi:MAG: extracellular solute-binding protein [Variibacter sp.]|nr:extracellular solute-binding protein [Variibacter sp.]
MPKQLSRRSLLKASAALAAASFAPRVSVAAAPPATATTPALVAAAQKEGRLSYYTSVDLPLAERIAKAFEATYSGISVKVERTGAERLFQRIAQEYQNNIHNVDVVNSSDAAHFVVWKNNGWLAPYVPEDIAKHYPAEHKDRDGMFASFRVFFSVIAYNTNLVPAAEAPTSFNDLLDPKWAGKMMKAHPGYSGTIMTATFQMARDLGWSYFETLAKQRVLQLQSASDPPKKLALGERAVQVDGSEYVILQLKEKGQPVEPVYAAEGSPMIVGPNGVFKAAPNPNAARLFQNFCFSPECQQLIVDHGGLHSAHALVKEKPGRRPLKEIKAMKDDPDGVHKSAEDIKRRYTQLFKV